jgi:hypothetical protein
MSKLSVTLVTPLFCAVKSAPKIGDVRPTAPGKFRRSSARCRRVQRPRHFQIPAASGVTATVTGTRNGIKAWWSVEVLL